MRLKRSEIAFLGNTRDAAVASNIGCEDGSKPAFDPRLGHEVRPDQGWLQSKFTGQALGMSIEPRMSPLGQERRIWAFLGTSAVTLNADIRLRRNI